MLANFVEDRIPETRASSKRSILKLMQDGVLDQARLQRSLPARTIDRMGLLRG